MILFPSFNWIVRILTVGCSFACSLFGNSWLEGSDSRYPRFLTHKRGPSYMTQILTRIKTRFVTGQTNRYPKPSSKVSCKPYIIDYYYYIANQLKQISALFSLSQSILFVENFPKDMQRSPYSLRTECSYTDIYVGVRFFKEQV